MGGGGEETEFSFLVRKRVFLVRFFLELCTKNRFFFAENNIDFCADS